MARPRRSHGTRERLLEQGVSAFVEHGFHGTGLQQVLTQVGVPKGSFYNYFDSKEAFGAEVILHYAACQAAKLADALGGTSDPLVGLRRFFKRDLKAYEESGFVGGCLVANLAGELEGSEVCQLALQEAFGGWREGVRAALAAGQEARTVRDDVTADVLADVLIEAWEGAVIRMKIERSVKPLRRCVRRLLEGEFLP